VYEAAQSRRGFVGTRSTILHADDMHLPLNTGMGPRPAASPRTTASQLRRHKGMAKLSCACQLQCRLLAAGSIAS
jgi:hypothetical protein